MSPYTETSRISWFGRLKNSIGGILFGFILFALSFVLIWYNEGRAVKTAKGLKEGAAEVVTVNPDSINTLNDNKLIHVSGLAISSDSLSDDLFGLKVKGLKLKRTVSMYQWKENKQTETDDKIGGAQETTTTYTYEKTWSSHLINSSNFKERGYENPKSIPIEAFQSNANQVHIGRYELSNSLVSKMNNYQGLSIPKMNDSTWNAISHLFFKEFTEQNESGFVDHHPYENGIHIGLGSPSNPKIGDVRIKLKWIPQGNYSAIGRQINDKIVAHTTSKGTTIELLNEGLVSSEMMFEKALKQNSIITWLLRAGGFFLMLFGISLILKPLVILASILPFLARIISFGTGLFAGILAAVLTLITIAIAWLFYRPILGISILVLGIGIFVYFYRKSKDNNIPEELQREYLNRYSKK